MGITEMIKAKRFAPGKGVTGPPPNQGARRFFFLLLTHPWKLIELNLLFLAFCLPVITIPAALSGMNRVLILLVREGNCFLWSDFYAEFKVSFFKSLPFGALFAFLLLDSYYAFLVSTAVNENSMLMLPTVIGFLLLGLTALYSAYIFVLLPTLELHNRDIAKNAFILMMTGWKTNLVILSFTAIWALTILAFFPYTVILLLLAGFSLPQLLICTAVNQPLQFKIIEPFEQL